MFHRRGTHLQVSTVLKKIELSRHVLHYYLWWPSLAIILSEEGTISIDFLCKFFLQIMKFWNDHFKTVAVLINSTMLVGSLLASLELCEMPAGLCAFSHWCWSDLKWLNFQSNDKLSFFKCLNAQRDLRKCCQACFKPFRRTQSIPPSLEKFLPNVSDIP